jgi:hypothetical protein
MEMEASHLKEYARANCSVVLAPVKPMGLFALSGVTGEGITALAEHGLPPAALIAVGRSPHQIGRLDAWIRLGVSRIDSETLTMVMKLAGAIAGIDPRPLHWQQGGHVPNIIVPTSGKRAYLFESSARIATDCADLIRQAKSLLDRQVELRAGALTCAADPLAQSIVANEPRSAAAETYRWHAELVRRLGATDEIVIDRSVALAAFRAGADESRVRSLLAASPVAKRMYQEVRVRKGADADTNRRSRKSKQRGPSARDLEVTQAVKGSKRTPDRARRAATAEVKLYVSQVIDAVLLDPGLFRTAASMLNRAQKLMNGVVNARAKRSAERLHRVAQRIPQITAVRAPDSAVKNTD